VSRSLGSSLPEPVRSRLEDEPARQLGLTILVLTVDGAEWPHVAMVSVGELVVTGESRLVLALWPSSTCAANLSRSGRATLALVTDGRSFSIRCATRREQMLKAGQHPALRAFELEVVEVIEDSAPYADLVSGVTYRLHDPEPTLARWADTRAALTAVNG
jgi:hypothetical protein